MYYKIIIFLIIILSLSSCASKKDIYYMQDIQEQNNTKVNYVNSLIQPNDVLSIRVSALNPEAAEIYNMQMNQGGQGMGGPGMMALMGYLVSPDYKINFPVLGRLRVKNMTTTELEDDITKRLVDGGHLKNPTVDVRLINAKFTIIGQADSAQTIQFTEQNITLIQALGLANGLDITTIRKDVTVIREEEGIRQIANLDLTKSDWMNDSFYYIKPNDVILVKPNEPGVKKAGFITNPGSLLGILGTAISLISLIIFTSN